MSMEEIKLDTIHNTVLRCRLVFFDIWHELAYEGPCRFGKGPELEPEFDKMINNEAYKGIQMGIKMNLPEGVELLEPKRYMNHTENWRVSETEMRKLAEGSEETDVYFASTTGRTGEMIVEFAQMVKKPVIFIGNDYGATINTSAMLARGIETYSFLTWDDFRKELRALRARKALSETRVLCVSRFGHDYSLHDANDSFISLDKVTEKLGVKFRYANLHEVIDQIHEIDPTTNYTTPGRKQENINAEDMEAVNAKIDELMAAGKPCTMERENMVPSLKMWRLVQKLLNVVRLRTSGGTLQEPLSVLLGVREHDCRDLVALGALPGKNADHALVQVGLVNHHRDVSVQAVRGNVGFDPFLVYGGEVLPLLIVLVELLRHLPCLRICPVKGQQPERLLRPVVIEAARRVQHGTDLEGDVLRINVPFEVGHIQKSAKTDSQVFPGGDQLQPFLHDAAVLPGQGHDITDGSDAGKSQQGIPDRLCLRETAGEPVRESGAAVPVEIGALNRVRVYGYIGVRHDSVLRAQVVVRDDHREALVHGLLHGFNSRDPVVDSDEETAVDLVNDAGVQAVTFAEPSGNADLGVNTEACEGKFHDGACCHAINVVVAHNGDSCPLGDFSFRNANRLVQGLDEILLGVVQ